MCFCLLMANFKCPFCIFRLVGLFPSNRRALLLSSEPCFTSSDSSRSCTHSFTTDLIPPSVPPKCIHLPRQKLLLTPPLVNDRVKILLFGGESMSHDVHQKQIEVQADVPGNYKHLICWIFIVFLQGGAFILPMGHCFSD